MALTHGAPNLEIHGTLREHLTRGAWWPCQGFLTQVVSRHVHSRVGAAACHLTRTLARLHTWSTGYVSSIVSTPSNLLLHN